MDMSKIRSVAKHVAMRHGMFVCYVNHPGTGRMKGIAKQHASRVSNTVYYRCRNAAALLCASVHLLTRFTAAEYKYVIVTKHERRSGGGHRRCRRRHGRHLPVFGRIVCIYKRRTAGLPRWNTTRNYTTIIPARTTELS